MSSFSGFVHITGFAMTGNTTVVVGTPEAAEAMFRAEGKYPARSSMDENMDWIYKKSNILSMAFAVGKDWKRVRSAASKQIIPRRVANYAPGLCEIGDGFVEYIKSKRDPEGYVGDVNSMLVKWAFQGISYVVFGEKLNTFDETRKDLLRFESAAIEFVDSIAYITFRPPLYRYFPTKAYRRFVKAINNVHEYGSILLREKYNKILDDIKSGVVTDKNISMMEQWLIEGNFSQKEVLNLSCDILAVGVDTTSNTATFLLHEVSKQQELQQRLYTEVKSILGEKKFPSFEDLQKMPLVRGCIKETLRLYPATLLLARLTDEPIEICGYNIPAKTSMTYSPYTACRDPKYVEDPNAFKPERWAKESSADLDGFVSVPFGFGPRSCYGRRLAELELYIMLCMISKNFFISTEQQSLKMVQGTVIKPDEFVKIKFTDRK